MKRRMNLTTMVRSMAALVALGLGASACDEAPMGRRSIPQPRSLSELELEIDGDLRIDAHGQVPFDEDARAFFDHFLAAEGEISDSELHTLVQAHIEQRLDGPAVDQAWDLFLAYLDYRSEATALLELEGVDGEQLAQMLDEIRARTIGDAPGVPDEGYRLEAAVELRNIHDDPTLNPQLRAEAVARVQLQLGDVQGPDAPSRILSRIHAALDEVPLQDVQTRRRVLVELVGDAAAERWLALERSRVDGLAAG